MGTGVGIALIIIGGANLVNAGVNSYNIHNDLQHNANSALGTILKKVAESKNASDRESENLALCRDALDVVGSGLLAYGTFSWSKLPALKSVESSQYLDDFMNWKTFLIGVAGPQLVNTQSSVKRAEIVLNNFKSNQEFLSFVFFDENNMIPRDNLNLQIPVENDFLFSNQN